MSLRAGSESGDAAETKARVERALCKIADEK